MLSVMGLTTSDSLLTTSHISAYTCMLASMEYFMPGRAVVVRCASYIVYLTLMLVTIYAATRQQDNCRDGKYQAL
jgi:hypothetical protein